MILEYFNLFFFLQQTVGCEKHGTGRFDDTRGGLCPAVDIFWLKLMMMMKKFQYKSSSI